MILLVFTYFWNILFKEISLSVGIHRNVVKN